MLSPEFVKAWGICASHAGLVNQVDGLLSAMRVDYVRYPVDQGVGLWRQLLSLRFAEHAFPAVAVSCGDRAAFLLLALKRRLGSRLTAIHIQTPSCGRRTFDYILCPRHNPIDGPNVITTELAINHITPELIAREARSFADDFAHLQKPICSVLLGGDSRHYRFDEAEIARLIEYLNQVERETQVSLVIVFSRRSSEKLREGIRRAFAGRALIWEDAARNPYLALLELSDYIICTGDSVSMVSEAIYAGKPVYLYRLESGKFRNRIEDFNNLVCARGYVRTGTSRLQPFTHDYEPETTRIAGRIMEEIMNNGQWTMGNE